MKRNCLWLCLFSLILLAGLALPTQAARKEKVYVIDVVGSTTLVVAPNKDATEGEEVEILGVIVPESIPGPDQEGENWGLTVRGYVKSTLVGQQVIIETDKQVENAQGKDGDDKTYVYVWINRKLFNEVMISKGYGRVDKSLIFGRHKALKKAESEAQEYLQGLWGVGKPKPVPNIQDYLKNMLQGQTFYLKIDALRLTKSGYSPDRLIWWPYEIDVTNVMNDGVYYRREGLSDRTADGFIAQTRGHDNMRFYNPQPIRRGEEVTITRVGYKKDCFFTDLATPGRQFTRIYFIYNKELRLVSEEEVFNHVYLAFAESIEELEAQETRTVEIGMTIEEVKAYAGLPQAELRPEPGVIVFIYEHFKVIFRDGRVEKLEY